MKRLVDIDEHQQGIPRNKKMSDLETGRLHVVGTTYVTQEVFEQMQADLAEAMDKLEVVFEQALIKLRQMELHLASMSDANIEPGDTEE